MDTNHQNEPKRPRGRPRSASSEQGSAIQSLDRGIAVLQILARQRRINLTELSQKAGIPTATTYRILTTLQTRGFAAFDEVSQNWMVGLEAYRVGSAYLQNTDLADVARPVLRDLMNDSGETANLAIADGGQVVFIGQVETQNPIRAFFQPGTRTKMHASGIGKAILAAMPRSEAAALLASQGLERFTGTTLVTEASLFTDLEQTLARGWSFDREERHEGMSCIGVAIHDERGAAIAGISISGPSARFTVDRVPLLGAVVCRAAEKITTAIAGSIPVS